MSVRTLLPLVLVGLGLACFAAAGATSPFLDRATISATDFDLGEVAINQSSELSFSITNSGWRALRIVGAQTGCAEQACGSLRLKLPREVAAGEKLEVTGQCEARVLGPFSYRFRVFTDLPEQSTITITVHGHATADRANDAG